MSPTARALAWFKKRGIAVARVERWVPQARRRVDVWGFGDLLVCGMLPGLNEETGEEIRACLPSIALVQVTTGANHAARRSKIEGIPEAKGWLQAGGRIWIMSFSKTGARGKRKTWTARIEEIETRWN